MNELTQLLRSQYTTDRHIIAGVGDHTTTAGQTSSHFLGRLVQRFERSLSAEVRLRNRAGVDAYIAQIRAVNADLADVAAAALAETRAQGKPLTVRRVRELGGGEISHMVQQQAAALMQDFFARGVFRADGQWHGDANDEQRLTMVRQSIELALAHLPEGEHLETSAALLSLAHKLDQARGREPDEWVIPAQRLTGKGQERVQVFNVQSGKLLPTTVTHAQWRALNETHAQYEEGQVPSTPDRVLRGAALALIEASGAHRGLRFINRSPTPTLVELARAVGYGVYTEFDTLHSLQAQLDAQALDQTSQDLLARYNAQRETLDQTLQFEPVVPAQPSEAAPSNSRDPVATTPQAVRDLRRFFADCLAPQNPLDLQIGHEPDRLKNVAMAHADLFVTLAMTKPMSAITAESGVPAAALAAFGYMLPVDLCQQVADCPDPQERQTLIRAHLNALPRAAYEQLAQGIAQSVEQIEPTVQAVMSQLSQDFGAVPGNLAKFLSAAFKRYYAEQSPADKRTMLASYMRDAVLHSKPPQALAALIKGAGPLMIKMLQMVGDNLGQGQQGRELRAALSFVKTDLPSIHPVLRNAMLAAVVEDSKGEIVALKAIRSLGAASVGETFLAQVEKADGSSEEVVIKLLRPGILERGGRERRFMDAVAQSIPGMAGTFAGLIDQIEGEMDMRTEAANVRLGQVYTDAQHPDVQSMTLSDIEQVQPYYMIAKRAPGCTAAHYLNFLTAFDPPVLYHPYTTGARLAAAVGHLAEIWVEEALFNSGFYHGDLHAGNLMYKVDEGGPNGLLTVIDFGNSRVLSPHERQAIFKMMVNAAMGNGEGFIPEFESILSAEAQSRMTPEVRQAFKHRIDLILADNPNKPGAAIGQILTAANELGLEVPGAIASFSRSELMLENTLKVLEERNESNWIPYQSKFAGITRETAKRTEAFNQCLDHSIDVLKTATPPNEAAAARLQQIKAIPFEDLNNEQIRFLQEVPVQTLGYLTRRLAQIHHLKHERPAAERPKGPTMESAIRNVLMRHRGDALRLGGTALSLRVAANLAAGV